MGQSGNNKVLASAIVIAAVVLIAFAASMFSKTDQDIQQADTNMQSQDSASTTAATEASTDSAQYKDGTYTVSDTYSSPGGIEDIKVTLVVRNNTVSSVDVVQEANNNESAEYQDKFQQSYKSKVVSKALSGLELSRSSGASLTTNAFNDALDEIRNQAKA